MASQPSFAERREQRPARSATPAAWMAFALLAILITGWVFFNPIVCGIIRLGLQTAAWNQGVELTIDHLMLTKSGYVQASGVVASFGAANHRSSLKSDWIEVRFSPLPALIGLSRDTQGPLIREILAGNTKLLIDRRGKVAETADVGTRERFRYQLPWMGSLPGSFSAGPVDLIVIGDDYRISTSELMLSLPNRWAGAVWYSEAALDVGSAHQVFPAASAQASWTGSTLQIGQLYLANDLQLNELTLTPFRDRLEFGVRGTVDEGLLRGDGAIGFSNNRNVLDATIVGENLKIESLPMLAKQEVQHTSGTIRQGRFTFRGDPDRPLEAESSLRLVADAFRWEGRGWDSLRVAATLTGRVLTLSELSLHQKDNEVEAEGQSNLPEDWHQALKAPFSATFHAKLEDAGALAALGGTEFSQLSGGLALEGAIKGAENKAEGYCTLLGSKMKLRNLPLDWLRGCLLFEGEKTKLSYLEAWSGDDRVEMEGSVLNSRPHTYAAMAEFNMGNLTKRLAELGISTASQIGGGAAQGTWHGDGSTKGHSGAFQVKVAKWISPWTTAGMSGSFEGTYSPGHLYCSKAEFQQNELRLDLQLAASPTRLEAKSITAVRDGKTDPLVRGDFSLPVNAPALWETGDLISNLQMGNPLALHLTLHGIKAEELADLLGQHIPATGSLEGELSASGTPESPEIHSTLKIAKLTLPDSSSLAGLTLKFDSTGGRATCSLVQESATNSPMNLHAESPFRIVADRGGLRVADGTSAVRAQANLHGVPVDGWISLFGGSAWGVRGGVLDGSLTVGGTLDKPSVEGSLMLTAHSVEVPGLSALTGITLPINCSLSKATTTGGTALYGDKPLALSGEFDWHDDPWRGHIDFSGKDLPFPEIAGLASRGDAEMSVLAQGTNPALVAGTLVAKNIIGTLPTVLTPFFSPPGFVLNTEEPIFPAYSGSSLAGLVQLNINVRTEGPLLLSARPGHEKEKLQTDLHLKGALGAPRWTGKIIALNHTIELPVGTFVVPETILQNVEGGREQIETTAFGMTPLGFCVIRQSGSINSNPWFEAVAERPTGTAADMLLALATSPSSASISTPLNQMNAWIRQDTFFAIPPIGWITRREESNEPDSLGFYGNPWCMSLVQATTTLPESTSPAKN